MEAQDYYCAHLSLETDEPLYGSAPEARVWLMLEYNRPWGAKALPESDLPEAIKAHINGWTDAIDSAKFLFIRQPGQTKREGIRFFVAITGEARPRLYAYTLASYEDLLELDVESMVQGDPIFAASMSDEPLYLVCTNAQRDRCCALYGVSIYNELQKQVGSYVWQCTHIGGHRFAPTGVVLPHGICYGRMTPDNVSAIVHASDAGEIALEYLRGQVAWDAPAQAADYLLRAQKGITAIDGVRLLTQTATGPDTWDMEFEIDGEKHNIRLQKYVTDVEIYTSCFNDKKAAIEGYRLI